MIDSTGYFVDNKKNGRWEYFDDTLGLLFAKVYSNDSIINIEYLHNKKDTIAEIVIQTTQKEAAFKNGQRGWNDYLTHNLIIPERFTNNMKPGKYKTQVCFLVNKSGFVEDIYLRKSVEWSADKEVLRILEHSPKWIPAVQDGKIVYYRQLQSISFSIDE